MACRASSLRQDPGSTKEHVSVHGELIHTRPKQHRAVRQGEGLGVHRLGEGQLHLIRGPWKRAVVWALGATPTGIPVGCPCLGARTQAPV